MRLLQLFLLALALVAGGLGQSLEAVLAKHSETLSTIHSWLQTQPAILTVLGAARGVTMLAPSNKAMDELHNSNPGFSAQLTSDTGLLTAFLSYHVLSGVHTSGDFAHTPAATFPTFMNNYPGFSNVTGGQVVQTRAKDGAVTFVSGQNAESRVQKYDLHYDNGVVHIIDSVLTIPHNLTNTAVLQGHTAMVGALRASGAELPFNHAPDVTIFAPSNDAFSAIGSLAVNLAVQDVAGILNYHVISGQVQFSWQVFHGGQLTASSGASINFRVEADGTWFVNSARVIASNILIGNGVLHIMDGVLNPSNQTATPDPAAATQAPAFAGASTTTCVPFTSVLATAAASTGSSTAAAAGKTTATVTATAVWTASPLPTPASSSLPHSPLAAFPTRTRPSHTHTSSASATPGPSGDEPGGEVGSPPKNSGPGQTAGMGVAVVVLVAGAAAFLNW
ncbi:Fasciclin-domain-containing protein [Parathielavia hyrcaniae]|uniref:Fasciclin-domain-containing protein n=1 Tax=Parathielavia hyrcaniae TaxID=113614 RepID=A0AAN6PWP7_9PEZI|nr:Fasciclin-domain-containing protein [Parathielavia hyrcaniae]